MKTPEEITTYSIICEKMPTPSVYFPTYELAVKWAKFNQPTYRPFYIVERTEHFEICGKISVSVKEVGEV